MSRTAVAKKSTKQQPPPDLAAVIERKPVLVVDVDWSTMPVLLAQQYYAQLKAHFEKAGAILNARTTGSNGQWVCYMADKSTRIDGKTKKPIPSDCPTQGQVLNILPRFTDYSHVDNKTGLIDPVRICSEICSIRYNQILIDERREKYAPKREE